MVGRSCRTASHRQHWTRVVAYPQKRLVPPQRQVTRPEMSTVSAGIAGVFAASAPAQKAPKESAATARCRGGRWMFMDLKDSGLSAGFLRRDKRKIPPVHLGGIYLRPGFLGRTNSRGEVTASLLPIPQEIVAVAAADCRHLHVHIVVAVRIRCRHDPAIAVRAPAWIVGIVR